VVAEVVEEAFLHLEAPLRPSCRPPAL
jgi:hypothetical protein